MPIVGSFAGASARAYGFQTGLIGDFESIATVTAGSAVPNIEFTSIPSTYTHLQIRGIVRTTSTGINSDELFIQFNSDTGTNYSSHELNGNGSTTGSSAKTTTASPRIGLIARNGNTANCFTSIIIDILDYKDTNKYTTIRCLRGWDSNGAGDVGLNSGNWRNTNAVTSIKLLPEANNFAQNSSFSLYGIKG